MMTRDELKTALAKLTGLFIADKDERHVLALSPSGFLVAEIRVYEADGGWEFGGLSAAFPESWRELCRLHEKPA